MSNSRNNSGVWRMFILDCCFTGYLGVLIFINHYAGLPPDWVFKLYWTNVMPHILAEQNRLSQILLLRR